MPQRPFAYSVSEAAKLVGISRASLYALINSGELEVVRLGRRVLVPIGSIAKLIGTSVPELLGGSDDGEAHPSASRAAAQPIVSRAQAGQFASSRFAAVVASEASRLDLDEATFVITVRRLKPGEKVRSGVSI